MQKPDFPLRKPLKTKDFKSQKSSKAIISPLSELMTAHGRLLTAEGQMPGVAIVGEAIAPRGRLHG